MKWLACLLILISISGSFCDRHHEETCYEEIHTRCLQNISLPGFPETPEQLLKACRTVEGIGTCVIGVGETCTEDLTHLLILNDIRDAVDYVKLACQEENPTFKAVSSNLRCIENVINSNPSPCRHLISEKNIELIQSHLEPYMQDAEDDMKRCVFSTLDLICDSVAFGYFCGEDVKDAVVEIALNLESRKYDRCTPEQREQLEPLLEVADAILLEELSLADSLEKRRK